MEEKIKQLSKDYWESHLPQRSYSEKLTFSKKYFDEMEVKRYDRILKYIPKVMNFQGYRNKKVLEIGCGMGTEILQFARNGAYVTAIDLTENAIKITKERFKLYGYKGGHFQVGDAENMTFKDDTFDLVYSIGVLHHTPNTEKAIREAYRVCKPNGNVLIMLYGKGWKHYLFRKFLYKLMPEENKNKDTEEFGCPILKVYSKKEAKKLFCYPVKITKWKMGPYFDWKLKAFGITLMPNFIIKIVEILNLQRIFGEHLIIEGRK